MLQGLRFTTATNAAILEACIPVYATVIGWIFGVESCSRNGCRMWQKIGGILLASSGAIFVVVTSDRGHAHIAHHPNSTRLFGNVLLWVSTVLLAAYMQVQTPLARTYDAIRLTAFSQCVCLVFSSVAGLVTVAFSEFENHAQWSAWHAESTFYYCLAYAVISITIVNFTIETWAIHRSSATTCAIFMCLEPPITIVLSSVILKEVCRPITFIGGAVIIIGMLINLGASGEETTAGSSGDAGGGGGGGGLAEGSSATTEQHSGRRDGGGRRSGGGGGDVKRSARYASASASGSYGGGAASGAYGGGSGSGSGSSSGAKRDQAIAKLFDDDSKSLWDTPAAPVEAPALLATTVDVDASDEDSESDALARLL